MSDGHIESDVVAMYVGVNPKEGMKSPKQSRSCRGDVISTFLCVVVLCRPAN